MLRHSARPEHDITPSQSNCDELLQIFDDLSDHVLGYIEKHNLSRSDPVYKHLNQFIELIKTELLQQARLQPTLPIEHEHFPALTLINKLVALLTLSSHVITVDQLNWLHIAYSMNALNALLRKFEMESRLNESSKYIIGALSNLYAHLKYSIDSQQQSGANPDEILANEAFHFADEAMKMLRDYSLCYPNNPNAALAYCRCEFATFTLAAAIKKLKSKSNPFSASLSFIDKLYSLQTDLEQIINQKISQQMDPGTIFKDETFIAAEQIAHSLFKAVYMDGDDDAIKHCQSKYIAYINTKLKMMNNQLTATTPPVDQSQHQHLAKLLTDFAQETQDAFALQFKNGSTSSDVIESPAFTDAHATVNLLQVVFNPQTSWETKAQAVTAYEEKYVPNTTLKTVKSLIGAIAGFIASLMLSAIACAVFALTTGPGVMFAVFGSFTLLNSAAGSILPQLSIFKPTTQKIAEQSRALLPPCRSVMPA